VIAFIAAVVVAEASAIGVAAASVTVRPHDVMLFAVLLSCTVASVELCRRTGENEGLIKDVHGVWELPAAILLPPVYVLVAPVIRIMLVRWRVRRGVLHRRVFSASSLGLSFGAASVTFHTLDPAVSARPTATAVRPLIWLLLVLVSAAVQSGLNKFLIMTAVKGCDPTVRVAAGLFRAEPLYNDLSELCIGVLIAYGLRSNIFLALIAVPVVVLLQRSLRHAQLLNASRTDAKTGLLNARTWEREAASEVARAVRARVPLAVAVLDIDWFKAVNDTYGHLFGDQVLAEIGRCLPGVLREYDLAGRFGGEEFVLLLPHTRAVDAFRVAERVRDHISGLSLRTADALPAGVTVSVGVAALDPGSRRELSELLAAADAALYRAKRDGRDQVQMISTTRGLSALGGQGAIPRASVQVPGSRDPVPADRDPVPAGAPTPPGGNPVPTAPA
jgi:diguanylate cyclase (GGDEF)-like protein